MIVEYAEWTFKESHLAGAALEDDYSKLEWTFKKSHLAGEALSR